MTSSPDSPYVRSIRRVVRFAQTDADKALLQAVEEALESQFHGNFSALCKQALRHLLLPEQEGRVISPLMLQEQIVALQQRVAVLEALGDRGGALEQGRAASQIPPGSAEADVIEPTPEAEVDPLLSRLAPFLEDF
jgi:hypothetical protein